MNKKILAIGIIGLIFIFGLFMILKSDERVILYSWDFDDLLNENDRFDEVIDELDINTLYQTFSKDYLMGNDSKIIKKLHKKDMLVYHLTGEREWGIGDDMSYIYNQIDLVYNFNKNNDNKIDGIAFDIEPYILDEWNDDSLGIYVDKMKKAYKYANNLDVYFILVIPYWYDSIDVKLLEDLFKNGGDEFSIMNYRIKSSIKNIENEVKFSKKYDKKINTIAEVGFKDDDKFSSFKEIDDDFKRIKDYYDYDISIAYHDYSTICKELFD